MLDWIQNPFYQLGPTSGDAKTYPDRDEDKLYLADGGWAGEVVPFWPLLQPDRKVDVIIAVDYVSRPSHLADKFFILNALIDRIILSGD